MMLRMLGLAILSIFMVNTSAFAQDARPQVSECQLIAEKVPGVMFARFDPDPVQPVAADGADVRITYLGHSTFEVDTPGGVRIVTDYNGMYQPEQVPTVATMNRAHSTHYTLDPEPGIAHILHGWSDVPGEKAQHHLSVGDAYIRNVTTDIRGFGGFVENGNSIFIFEVAGLCIGHLGHLHHELTEAHYADIGRLDVVMVPVDGGLTMGPVGMSNVVRRLHSSLILPMHRRGPPIGNFLAMFGEDVDSRLSEDSTVYVSVKTLPKRPLILVLKGV